MPKQQMMDDKTMLTDALTSQKTVTTGYNTFANECACPNLRQEMMDLLSDEHDIQYELFQEMDKRGWYPTTPAEKQKITDLKKQFESEASC